MQTDFQTEPPWVQEEVDVYCVGSEEARSELVNWGVSPNRILVSGIPVDPVFSLPGEKSELRRALGLDPERPVVLVMGGGMGPAPLDKIVESLELCRFPLQVIAVAGHDRALEQALEELRRKVTLDLRVFGWTDAIPELMAAATLLITKPGGLTSAEALCAGLPMIVTHPIPGPEERHVRYLVQQGVAVAGKDSGGNSPPRNANAQQAGQPGRNEPPAEGYVPSGCGPCRGASGAGPARQGYLH